jgi:hypothetical protein
MWVKLIYSEKGTKFQNKILATKFLRKVGNIISYAVGNVCNKNEENLIRDPGVYDNFGKVNILWYCE